MLTFGDADTATPTIDSQIVVAERTVTEESPALAAQPSSATPSLTVAEELVSVRTGPGVGFERIGMAARGKSFEIIGKNGDGAWLQICCFEDAQGWMVNQYITIYGATDRVAVVSPKLPPSVAGPDIPQAPESTDSESPASTMPDPTEQDPTERDPTEQDPTEQGPAGQEATGKEPAEQPFALELQDQHSEANIAVIYAWIHESNNPLDGYFLRITKDGQILENAARSSALDLGTTRPTKPEGGEDKVYNFKTDFNIMSHPDFDPAGTWTIQLLNGAGEAISPIAQFTLAADEFNKEMYVRFGKR